MIFYRVGNMLLFIFVVLLLFGSFWHLYIWSDFFLRHIAYTLCLAILSAFAIRIIVYKINNLLRENTLNNILKGHLGAPWGRP